MTLKRGNDIPALYDRISEIFPSFYQENFMVFKVKGTCKKVHATVDNNIESVDKFRDDHS